MFKFKRKLKMLTRLAKEIRQDYKQNKLMCMAQPITLCFSADHLINNNVVVARSCSATLIGAVRSNFARVMLL